MDPARVLPDDVLADVFGRLAPRCLAASRCVCRDWRAAIDGRRLLRAELLPLSLGGIFLQLGLFFARPSSSAAIGDSLDFLLDASHHNHNLLGRPRQCIHDHCNGLLLLRGYVVNPATRRCDPLPTPPAAQTAGHGRLRQTTYTDYLAFDPTVSPHYEVFLVPGIFSVGRVGRDWDDFDPLVEESKWPASPCVLRVFSSETGRWEERPYVREGDLGVLGTGVKFRALDCQDRAVYWRRALYLHREANVVVRISLLNNTYCVIKPPKGMGLSVHPTRYLARSEKGVYFAALDKEYHLRVWILAESSGRMEWQFKHGVDLQPALADRRVHGPWVLKHLTYRLFSSHPLPEYTKKNTTNIESKFEWNSDSDDDNEKGCCSDKVIVEPSFYATDEDAIEQNFVYQPQVTILGFHPYREIVFLASASTKRGLAYHLNSSKLDDLGDMHPNRSDAAVLPVGSCFTYTPCWL